MRYFNVISNDIEEYEEPGQISVDNVGLRDRVNRRFLSNRTVILSCDTEPHDATTIVGLFLLLDAESQEPITLIINSPGGNVAGLTAIYDVMQMVRSPVRTICIGDASSAAAILLAAGTKGLRYATQNSHVMIHQIQISEGSGTASATDYEIEIKASKKIKRRLNEILARHTGQTYRKVYQDCERDKYMTAQEALDYGIIDEIIKPYKPIPPLKKRQGTRKKKKKPDVPVVTKDDSTETNKNNDA